MISLTLGCRYAGGFVSPIRAIKDGVRTVGGWWSCILMRQRCVPEEPGRLSM